VCGCFTFDRHDAAAPISSARAFPSAPLRRLKRQLTPMTATKDRQAAKAIPAESRPNLNYLPAEIINIIVQILRNDESIEYTPSSKTCRCHPPRQAKKLRKRKALLFSRVPWISLSSVSKRLRNIVFDHCMNRELSTLLCPWEYQRSLEASQDFRHHVT
jgi:hypothetical protein